MAEINCPLKLVALKPFHVRLSDSNHFLSSCVHHCSLTRARSLVFIDFKRSALHLTSFCRRRDINISTSCGASHLWDNANSFAQLLPPCASLHTSSCPRVEEHTCAVCAAPRHHVGRPTTPCASLLSPCGLFESCCGVRHVRFCTSPCGPCHSPRGSIRHVRHFGSHEGLHSTSAQASIPLLHVSMVLNALRAARMRGRETASTPGLGW